MQTVSNAWRENQAKPMTSEGFVELSYYFTDPNIQVTQIHASPELTPVSQVGEIINQHTRHVTPFGTLEPNLWLLDGTHHTVPETFGEPRPFAGFISNPISNASGQFTTAPSVEIVLEEPARILPGLTIEWDVAFGLSPRSFVVTAFGDTGQSIGRGTFETDGQEVHSLIAFEMVEVKRIHIEILSTGIGNRRARIANVFLGHKRVYTKDSLFAYSSSHQIDPVSARLPKYEIAFKIDNREGDFDPIDDESISRYVLERQEITARYGFQIDDEIQWIPGGQYFLSDWQAPQNGLSANFRARDVLGFLDNIYHKGAYSPNGTSLFDLAQNVLEDAIPTHLGNRVNRWEIDPALRHISTVSPLPMVSHAQCLQLIANAAGATLTIDQTGFLHMKTLRGFTGETDHTLDEDNSFTRPEIDFLRPLKSVQVSAYHWQVEEEETVLYDEELPLEVGENTFLIEYSDAATDMVPTLTGMHNMEITLFARAASIVIHRTAGANATCQLTLRGKIIRPAETVITAENSDRGETLPLKNVLITDIGRANIIARWLLKRYQNRKNVSTQWRLDPSHEVSDFVALGSSENPKVAQILSTDFRFSGAFMGKSEGVILQ